MIRSSLKRARNLRGDLGFFLGSICLAGFSGSIVDAVFNNYLSETYSLSSIQRTLLEIPRETPGLIVLFVTALLFFMCTRRLAAFSMVLSGLGLFLLAFATPNLRFMLAWLFIMSMGQHLFMPLNSTIGMELAREGATGKRLGQLNSARNIAGVLGSLAVFAGFRYLHFTFTRSFCIAAIGFCCASLLLTRMEPRRAQPAAVHLKLHKEYGLFYWLSILYGTRKQIFITFAPWVLVTVFHQPTQVIATLLFFGGVAGIVFQPILGRTIDKMGERFVLAGEAVILVFVCLAYGFSKMLFAPQIAFWIVCACYVTDQLLMSVGMARATYLKKIARDPRHVAPALTAAVSMDHVFSISCALASGWAWHKWGYQTVFVLGACIACVNFFSALRIRIPVYKRAG